MRYFAWNEEKNVLLRKERGISFEEIVFHIEKGDLLDIVQNRGEKYRNQFMFVVKVENYAYLVPFVEGREEVFLKTIIPSRKATRKYLKKR